MIAYDIDRAGYWRRRREYYLLFRDVIDSRTLLILTTRNRVDRWQTRERFSFLLRNFWSSRRITECADEGSR